MVRCLATYAIDVALALAFLKLEKMILLGGVVHSGEQFTVVTMRGKNNQQERQPQLHSLLMTLTLYYGHNIYL